MSRALFDPPQNGSHFLILTLQKLPRLEDNPLKHHNKSGVPSPPPPGLTWQLKMNPALEKEIPIGNHFFRTHFSFWRCIPLYQDAMK